MTRFMSRFKDQSSVALIVTLAVVSVALLLVIGFAISMRTEQVAARNFSQVVFSKQLAQAAIDEAVFLIRTNTPIIRTSSPMNSFWVSQPGRIVRLGQTPKALLYSTNSAGGVLNINFDQSIIASNPSVYTTAASREIDVEWITIGTNGGPAGIFGTFTNPIVGRYGYWSDDEASKVNINSAGWRTNTATSVMGSLMRDTDLTVLPNIAISAATNTWLYANRTNYFTPEQWRFTSGVGAATSRDNKSYVTADSEAVGKTPWGSKRFYLDSSFATWQDEIDNGCTNTMNSPGLTNWFGVGNTFTNKYTLDILKQLMANMADFRYRAGSSGGGDWACMGAGTGYLDTGGSGYYAIPKHYLGLRRYPHLNEIGVMGTYCRPSGAKIQAKAWILVEVVNPYDQDWGSSGQILVHMDKLIYRVSGDSGAWNYHCGFDSGWNDAACGQSGKLGTFVELTNSISANIPARSYQVFQLRPWHECDEGNFTALVDKMYVKINRVRLLQGTGNDTIRDWAYVSDFDQYLDGFGNHFSLTNIPSSTVYVQWDSSDCSATSISVDNSKTKALAKNDPRVRRFTSASAPPKPAWYRVGYDTTTNATIGTQNTSVVDFTGGTGRANVPNDPPPSTTFGVTNHPSFYMKTSLTDTNYESSGELGYIHTGLQWRTLALQPRQTNEITANLIPDWAVLDLFATTNIGVQGRMNINAAVTNLYSGNSNWKPRVQPLRALLTAITASNAMGNSTDQDKIATNIYNMSWVNNNATLGWAARRNNGTFNFTPGVYNMIGELCEVDNVSSNWNPSTAYTNDFVRENRIRSFANLVTTRSERFRVWGIGQSILEPDVAGQTYGTFQPGVDLIQGESKAEALVKRYQDAVNGNYGDSDDTLAYRIIYFRYLTEAGTQ